ncbi:hypothetical protein [Bernardetia sp.]|uniref:hypothetical protein n=1 Tax=Bernardetia sp. TaxID=1937974 RepID=UPI0025C258EC|nr:hypothetical protein [Bernardetia sp.]
MKKLKFKNAFYTLSVLFLIVLSCKNKNTLPNLNGTYTTFNISYKGENLIQSGNKIAFAKQIQIDENNILLSLGYDRFVVAKLDYKNDSTLAIYKSSDKRFNGKYNVKIHNAELELNSEDIYIYAQRMNLNLLD